VTAALLDSPCSQAGTVPLTTTETSLINALKAGDERAFVDLVERYHGPLKRLARSFGASDAVAEEIVQDTWAGALQGLDGFEERSSLRTWLFTILKNQAGQRSAREKRSLPLSAFDGSEGGAGPVVDPDRFRGPGDQWPGGWLTPPRPWEEPDRRLTSMETRDRLRDAMAGLPPRQRVVVALRDVEGLSSDEVCEVLSISETNQRVLLHRGRSAIRNQLEEYIDG
jgi:RNA polymerase sigma-70 factor (ECF subfamily)